jgi:hypothetical protein
MLTKQEQTLKQNSKELEIVLPRDINPTQKQAFSIAAFFKIKGFMQEDLNGNLRYVGGSAQSSMDYFESNFNIFPEVRDNINYKKYVYKGFNIGERRIKLDIEFDDNSI